jgi:hypothetical protein
LSSEYHSWAMCKRLSLLDPNLQTGYALEVRSST